MRHYFVRRALRILPLYWSVVIVGTPVTARSGSDLLRGLPYLVFVWPDKEAALPWQVTGVWWTLQCEAAYHLLLPLLGVVRRDVRFRWIAGLAAVGGAVAYAFFLFGQRDPGNVYGWVRFVHSPFMWAPVFGIGVLASWIRARLEPAATAMVARHPRRRDLLLLALLLAQGALLQWAVVHRLTGLLEPRGAFPWHFLEASIWAAVILVVVAGSSVGGRVLRQRPLRWAGKISYSIYLLHVPLIAMIFLPAIRTSPDAFRGWGSPAALLAVCAIVVVLAASALSFRCIEAPFLRMKTRLGAERR